MMFSNDPYALQQSLLQINWLLHSQRTLLTIIKFSSLNRQIRNITITALYRKHYLASVVSCCCAPKLNQFTRIGGSLALCHFYSKHLHTINMFPCHIIYSVIRMLQTP